MSPFILISVFPSLYIHSWIFHFNKWSFQVGPLCWNQKYGLFSLSVSHSFSLAWQEPVVLQKPAIDIGLCAFGRIKQCWESLGSCVCQGNPLFQVFLFHCYFFFFLPLGSFDGFQVSLLGLDHFICCCC